MDISLAILIIVYGIWHDIFYWLYDWVKTRVMLQNKKYFEV